MPLASLEVTREFKLMILSAISEQMKLIHQILIPEGDKSPEDLSELLVMQYPTLIRELKQRIHVFVPESSASPLLELKRESKKFIDDINDTEKKRKVKNPVVFTNPIDPIS